MTTKSILPLPPAVPWRGCARRISLLPDGNLHDVLAEADRQSVAVVLVSGDPRQAEAIDPGRSFLAKPFTQATLLAILDSASGAAG